MTPQPQFLDSARYARCIELSKRVRWDLERDVIRGRKPDFTRSFLPAGLTRADGLAFLSPKEKIFFGQVQGRTYASMFGLVERFIAAKMLEVSRGHGLGDQVALEALVRLTDEELKHQELFRRVERLAADGMPAGYRFEPRANPVAQLVLGKSTWAVLALTCMIELFTQAHYRESIEPGAELCELWKDVFLFHWKEESQHAVLDELEWMRENARLSAGQRDAAVDDLIGLVAAMDLIVQVQAKADAAYFMSAMRSVPAAHATQVHRAFLAAYRWQYIGSGAQNARFGEILGGMVSKPQAARLGDALRPVLEAA